MAAVVTKTHAVQRLQGPSASPSSGARPSAPAAIPAVRHLLRNGVQFLTGEDNKGIRYSPSAEDVTPSQGLPAEKVLLTKISHKGSFPLLLRCGMTLL